MTTSDYTSLWTMLTAAWQQTAFESLSVTGPQNVAAEEPRKFVLRPVQLAQGKALQWTAFDRSKRQTHQNHAWEESLTKLQQLLGTHYLSGHLKTTQEEVQIRFLPSGKLQLKRIPRKETPAAPLLDHNLSKQYLFPEGRPCPFLIATGIMTETGQVRKAMYRKFRQINRFAEFVYDLRDHLPRDRAVRIVDYGCGKSYLTFAVRHLLVEVLGMQIEMLGLDTNPAVITACQNTRDQLELTDVDFQVARIAQAPLTAPLDLAIWLHACDTATDEALARSVQLQAELILAVPCCQHELHSQLQQPAFQPLLKHGILRERLASLATDALRAQLLEAHGYRTQIMEFIDLEHTAKNLLLRSVRNSVGLQQKQQAWQAYQTLKQELQVTQFALETLLGPPRELLNAASASL